MKFGQKLGCPLGDPVHNLVASRSDTNPKLLHLVWNSNTDAEIIYQIWVNGYLQKTTNSTDTDIWISVTDENAQNSIEIIAVGAFNEDEDCYHLLDNAHGNHAIVKWRDGGNTKEYLVSYDEGDGSIDWGTTLQTITDTDTDGWYQYKSGELVSGTYKYGIRPRGFDGSVGPVSADVPVTINTYPLSVSGLDSTMYEADHMVALSWEEPADTSWDEGRVYWNNGNGEIDWEHMLVSGVTGVTATVLNDFGQYKFGIRSQSNSNGLENADWDKIVSFDMTVGWSIQPTLPLAPYAFTVSGVSMQYWNVYWRYNRSLEDYLGAEKITHFDLCGSGLTGVDWSYVVASVTAGITGNYGFCEQSYVNPEAWPPGTYHFGVRPMNIAGFKGPGVETALYMSGTMGSMVTAITVASSQ